MTLKFLLPALAVTCGLTASSLAADAIPVTPDNFVRAESDLYFGNILARGALGQFGMEREPADVADQSVVRLNRDTLYGSAVFDLDAGPVTITLPDAGDRFLSMQIINEDQYTQEVVYEPGAYQLTKDAIGTRYVVAAIRILVNPNEAADVAEVHALQDAIKVEQPGGPGVFEVPNWDQASQTIVRDALLTLASTLPDTKGMFGTKDEVDPVRRLIGAASAWGGNPEKDALYLNVVPERNDGTTIYRLSVKDVPVDGFWSVSLYNGKGYYEPNPQNAYSLNSLTAARGDDGSVVVQFGGCEAGVVNCLPITKDWNYMVRLYRPRAEILDGSWAFPKAEPVN